MSWYIFWLQNGPPLWVQMGFPGSSDDRFHLQCERPGFNPWVGKIPWKRGWQLTPVFLPGEFHGWRSLAGYSPWGQCFLPDPSSFMTNTYNIILHWLQASHPGSSPAFEATVPKVMKSQAGSLYEKGIRPGQARMEANWRAELLYLEGLQLWLPWGNEAALWDLQIRTLFLAAPVLHSCSQAFSSCGEWGLLSSCGVRASHRSSFSCCSMALSGGAPVVVMHWLRCPCGVFLDKGSNQCPLHWQVDS